MSNPLLDALGPAPEQEELLFEDDAGDATEAITFTDLARPALSAARPALSAARRGRPRASSSSGPRASGALKHLAYSQAERPPGARVSA